MKVSIITITFNSESTIKDTLESIAHQNYSNIEHIIIDANSTDNTLSIVKSYPHVTLVISEPDEGIYDAMNKGIKLAKGDIIGILNSDDFYISSSVIEKVARVFKDTKCDATYADLNYVDKADKNRIKRKWKSGEYKMKRWYFGWMPPHPTFFIKREHYSKYGLYNLTLKLAADYELMLRMCLKHKLKFEYLPEVIVHMREGGISNASLENRIRGNREDLEAWKINQLTPYPFTTLLKPIRKVSQYFRNLF